MHRQNAAPGRGAGGNAGSAGDAITQLFKLDASLSDLSNGVQAAHEYGPENWKVHAESLVRALAATGCQFTVDDLRRAGLPDPDKPQRWGSLFAVMQKRGIIALAGVQLHKAASGNTIGIRTWRGTRNGIL